MMNHYDAIVVGSGPAGSTAAYYLSSQGRKVLVLEKQSLPRYKTCGGGLSLQMLKQFPFSFDPVIDIQVQKTTYALKGETATFTLPPRSIGMVMRDQFDAFILEHARADVLTNRQVVSISELPDRVQVQTQNGETFEGEYLIGADGANSLVARKVGPGTTSRNVAAIEVEAKVSSAIQQRFQENPLFIFGAMPFGYLWVFPKKDHLSVGVAAYHPRPGQLQAVLQQEMKRYGITWENGVQHGHPIPVYTRRKKVSSSRILLAGDAAALVDPFTGEGIRFAIQSGRIAAESIISDKIAGYQGQIDRQIGKNHRLGLGLAYLFYHFPSVCFALGVLNPNATRAFTHMLSGDWGYRQVILRLFGTLPVHIAQQSFRSIFNRGEK